MGRDDGLALTPISSDNAEMEGDKRPDFRPGERNQFEHLRVDPGSLCWWCQKRPATTGEHKFKRSDLARLMGNDSLVWGEGSIPKKEIKGRSGITRDRNKVLKFAKSLCESCNTNRSQPFDRAYDLFSRYVSSHWLRIAPGISLEVVYGGDWESESKNLARYYAKHFGCRMVRSRLPVPASLREFMDGASDMSDAHLGLITADSIHRTYGGGLIISSDVVNVDSEITRFTRYVMASYIGSIGVRYEWNEGGIAEERRSQFFQFPYPELNCFEDEYTVATGETRPSGWFARFCQWVNRPR